MAVCHKCGEAMSEVEYDTHQCKEENPKVEFHRFEAKIETTTDRNHILQCPSGHSTRYRIIIVCFAIGNCQDHIDNLITRKEI